MKISCNIIKDLLPLYCDNMCSDDSRAVVEEHLKECEACGGELEKMRDNSDTAILRQEGNRIIGKYRKNVVKKILFFLSCVLLFPNIVMFAGCSDFHIPLIRQSYLPEWYWLTVFILLSAVYIPAVVRNRRREWIILSSLICPLLFALSHCVFYGLDSLFSLFALVPAGAFLLISAACIPAKLKLKPLDAGEYKKTALKMMTLSTAVIPFAGIASVLSCMTENFWDSFKQLWIVAFFTAFVWIIFAVYRFARLNNISKWGICVILTGLFISSSTEICDLIRGKIDSETKAFWGTDFFVGSTSGSASTANTYLIILIISVVIGVTMMALGRAFSKVRQEKENGIEH